MTILKIRVVDLETTGMAPPDSAPCEVGTVDLRWSDGVWGLASPPLGALCNPSRPIPPEASAVHHIIDTDVSGKSFWPEALRVCADTDSPLSAPDAFAAHNAKFERQWLTEDITGGKPWICTYKCALRIWPDAPSHSNQAVRYWLNPSGLNRRMASPPHSAGPDAYVTAFLLLEMLKKKNVETLIEWSKHPALLTKLRFGKHAGKLISKVPADYLEWILKQKDMDEDVAFSVRHELQLREVNGRES